MTLPLNVVHRMKSSSRRSKVITVVLAIAFWVLFVIMACLLVSDKQQIDEVTEARDAAIAEQKQLEIEIHGVRQEKRKVDVDLGKSDDLRQVAEQGFNDLTNILQDAKSQLTALSEELKSAKAQLKDQEAVIVELKDAKARLTDQEAFIADLQDANAQLKQETVVAQLRERTAQLEEVEAQLKEEWDAAAAISKAEGDERMLLQHCVIYTRMEDVRAKLEAENKQLRRRAADRDGTGRAHSLPRPQKSLYRM